MTTPTFKPKRAKGLPQDGKNNASETLPPDGEKTSTFLKPTVWSKVQRLVTTELFLKYKHMIKRNMAPKQITFPDAIKPKGVPA